MKPIAALFSRSPWLPLCLGLLLGIVAATGLQLSTQQQTLAQQDEHYGQALAALAARQAVDATLNHDLVSLQVILRDIAENPRIDNATIHDVENRLLVQAGSTPNLNASPDALNFSAPITFHNSVAGYVTLSLQQPDHATIAPVTLSLGLIVLIAILIIGAKPARNNQTANNSTDDSADNSHQETPTKSNPAGSIPIANLKPMMSDMPAKKHTVDLNLYLKNLSDLKRQLSSPLLKQLLDSLEQQVKGVCALYKGQVQAQVNSAHSHIQIKFRGADIDSSAFNALCCAHLLQRFSDTQSKGIKLQLNASITPERQSHSLMEQISGHEQLLAHESLITSQTAGSLLIEQALFDNAALEDRIQSTDLNQYWLQVEQVQAPYSELLDKQFEQLKELHS
ncbi:hypothetical protein R50073_05650 [Maricurvus nonylphenolicus]|uniref:hypothetical protein n=1 Tax=Maricurvus nonylphenolicus TaxID=1008307 RepID=UPI0036F22AA8